MKVPEKIICSIRMLTDEEKRDFKIITKWQNIRQKNRVNIIKVRYKNKDVIAHIQMYLLSQQNNNKKENVHYNKIFPFMYMYNIIFLVKYMYKLCALFLCHK